MTRGLKSSEFYTTLIALCIGTGLAIYGVDGGIIASVISPAIAFIGSRGAVKFKRGES